MEGFNFILSRVLRIWVGRARVHTCNLNFSDKVSCRQWHVLLAHAAFTVSLLWLPLSFHSGDSKLVANCCLVSRQGALSSISVNKFSTGHS